MKTKILFLAVALLALSASLQAQPKKVLFIGNSYTEVNNLPRLVQLVSESAGDRLEYQSNTPGGCTFQQHCNNHSMNSIRQGGWDVVVLQEQSQLPSFPQPQVEVELFPYAQQLVEAVYNNNPEGEAMFYMTWGRKYGDQQNAPYFPVLGTYEGMDSMLYERYMYMARQYDASVCPVGRVWRYLRTNYPEIELYQSDGSHPSLAGSYAAACAFYTLIFHRSPQYITYPHNIHDSLEIDSSQAVIIREAVQTVVFDTLSFWLRQPADTTHTDTIPSDTTHVDTSHTDTTVVGIRSLSPSSPFTLRLSPNPASHQVLVSVSPALSDCRAILSDLKGRQLRTVSLTHGSAILPLHNLPAGVYIVSVISPQAVHSSRIVVH